LGVDENGSFNGFPVTPNKLFMQEVLILMPLLTFYLLGMSNFCLTNLFVFVSFFNIVYRSSKKVLFFVSAFVWIYNFFLCARCIGEPIYVRESRASGFCSYLIVFMFGVVIWMNWIFVFTFGGCVSDD
jgi:hypothetical protein